MSVRVKDADMAIRHLQEESRIMHGPENEFEGMGTGCARTEAEKPYQL